MIKFSEENNYKLEMDLFSKIVPSECSTSYLSTKIEIKLKKENQSIRWTALEHTGEKLIPTISQEPKVSQMASKSKNWDKIAEEVAKGENLDELDGGDPLNKVFQNIYSNATDEQRRAMQKSFVTSFFLILLFYFLKIYFSLNLEEQCFQQIGMKLEKEKFKEVLQKEWKCMIGMKNKGDSMN